MTKECFEDLLSRAKKLKDSLPPEDVQANAELETLSSEIVAALNEFKNRK